MRDESSEKSLEMRSERNCLFRSDAPVSLAQASSNNSQKIETIARYKSVRDEISENRCEKIKANYLIADQPRDAWHSDICGKSRLRDGCCKMNFSLKSNPTVHRASHFCRSGEFPM